MPTTFPAPAAAIHGIGEWLCRHECFRLAWLVARGDIDFWDEVLDDTAPPEMGGVISCAHLLLPPGSLAGLDDDDIGSLETAVQSFDMRMDGNLVHGTLPDLVSVGEAGHRARRYATWRGLWFRSQTEKRIAQALERTGVAYWVNAQGRFGSDGARENRESDFVVMTGGKVGLLEIDGGSHRQRAADDHDRDRLFRLHGLKVTERYPAERCYAEPDAVVAEFLRLLMLNG